MASIAGMAMTGWNYEPACDRWWCEDVMTGKRVYARMIDGRLVQFPTEEDIDWGSAIDQSRHDDRELKFAAIGKEIPAGAIVMARDVRGVYYRMPQATMADVDPATLEIGHIDGVSMHTSDALLSGPGGLSPFEKEMLRDQFAMHFLGGVVAKHGLFSVDAPNVAIRAYEFADAMMHAREMKRG